MDPALISSRWIFILFRYDAPTPIGIGYFQDVFFVRGYLESISPESWLPPSCVAAHSEHNGRSDAIAFLPAGKTPRRPNSPPPPLDTLRCSTCYQILRIDALPDASLMRICTRHPAYMMLSGPSCGPSSSWPTASLRTKQKCAARPFQLSLLASPTASAATLKRKTGAATKLRC